MKGASYTASDEMAKMNTHRTQRVKLHQGLLFDLVGQTELETVKLFSEPDGGGEWAVWSSEARPRILQLAG